MLKRFALLALLAAPLFAAGTVVQTGPTRLNSNTANGAVATWTITLAVTGDSSTGTVPDTAVNSRSVDLVSTNGMSIISMVTDPGSTAPTDNYDIVITDARGYDLLGGAGANRDTATTENAAPTAPVPINGPITFSLSNNSVASATITVVLTLTNSTVAKNGGGGSSGGVSSLAATSPVTTTGATGAITVACATCVVASAPGAGVAHFAGSTQTVTSSAIVNADITNSTIDLTSKVTGILPTANGGSVVVTTSGAGYLALPGAAAAVSATGVWGAKVPRYLQFVLYGYQKFTKLTNVPAVAMGSATCLGTNPCGFTGAVMDSSCAMIAGTGMTTITSQTANVSNASSFATPFTLAPGVYYLQQVTDSSAMSIYGVEDNTAFQGMLNGDTTPRWFSGSTSATGDNGGLTPAATCGTRTPLTQTVAVEIIFP